MEAFIRSKGVLFLCLLLLSASLHSFAIDERYAAKPLSGNQLRKDSFSIVQDSAFYDNTLRPFQISYAVRNLVTFRINEFANLKLPDTFNISITFKIFYTRKIGDTTGVSDSTSAITLTIGYNKNSTYDGKALYTFKGGYSSKVSITNVTVNYGTLSAIENSLLLENEIQVTREYLFSCTNNAVDTVSNTDLNNSKGELKVYWTKERPADEYDLEWTYIDSSADLNYRKDTDTSKYDPRKIFTNNASRVSIAREEYNIPLLYDSKGKLFFRVRSVQVKRNGQRIESGWSSDYAQGLGKFDYNGHERLLNWQATTSFAEEGKRKSVVQYFDGSLRSRQTVTKDNTTDTTIVAESFYDYQGRPVIQVLPTPSLSSIIKFTPNYNAAVNGAEYEKDLYDGAWSDSCYCRLGAPKMDSTRGSSRYYSPANPNINIGFHKYIPNAKGYAFTETRYTADNTGRIAIQSGVGYDFQIGKKDPDSNTHETKYFYGSADQEELDALFGTEAGKASHYFKNMVRDANGQYSVSYVDMHGRTIATALAGKPTSKLDTLVTNLSRTITKKLLDSNNNIVKGTVIESSKGLLVTKAGNNRFVYSLLPDSISIKDCNNASICYDCKYDLEITITDECNNTSFPTNAPIVITRSNAVGYDTTCNPNVAMATLDTTIYLKEGNYLITKKFSISKVAMDYYRDSIFMRRNACKTIDTFIQQQKVLLRNLLVCQPTCQSCIDSLGTWATFRPKYLQQLGIPTTDTASYREQALTAYNSLLAECDALCSNTGLHTDIRRQMLADVTPPAGQYANPANIDEYSIFRTSAGNASKKLYSEVEKYLNESGKDDLVLVNGVWTSPQNLGIDDFINNFKSSWADALLVKHPEYCKLQQYDLLKASHIWDEKFASTQTFKAAKDSGYLNPANFSGLPANGTFAYYSQRRDPLFVDLAPSYKQEMLDSLNRKVIITASPLDAVSAWSLATISAHCKSNDNACQVAFKNISTAFSMDTSCSGELDIAWISFREMYLQEKREIIYKILNVACPGQVTIDPARHFINFPNPNQFPSGIPSTSSGAQDSLGKFTDSNCIAYATQWWEELAPCNFQVLRDSARIVTRLIKICSEGGDVSHPLGASSVKPASTYNFRSFEQFLKFYCDSLGVSNPYNASCNVYLISVPRPYEQSLPYATKTLYNKPDSCECDKINYYYQRYQAYGQQDANFAAFIFRTTGVSISNGTLDTLRNSCNGTLTCNFLKNPVDLPVILQCGSDNVCIGCTQMGLLVNEYAQTFPGNSPSRNDDDSTQHIKNILFRNFMNAKLGYSRDVSDYLDFMDSCGIVTVDSTLLLNYNAATVTCNQLTALANEYYYQFINPASKVVELDMRTFAGNKTPDAGPKGVFDVNGKLIARTDTGTVVQIKQSYAAIWNNSSVNKLVGTLFYNDTIKKFRLYLNPGQQAPCNSIIGMRYYQFDANVYDTLRYFGTAIGSYIDFGDSTSVKVENNYQDAKTTVTRYDLLAAHYEYKATMGTGYIAHSRTTLNHYYTHTALRNAYPVTVYHTDTLGVVNFTDYQAQNQASQFSNLRGYFPQHLLEVTYSGTRDSTINRTSQVKNFTEISSIQYVNINSVSYPGSPSAPIRNNFGSFANNHDLRLLRLDVNYQFIPNYQQAGVVDGVAGKHWQDVFPDLKNNFPELRVVIFGGWKTREQDLLAFNYELARLKHLANWNTDGPAGFADSVYNQLARVTTSDSSETNLNVGNISRAPTATSTTARNFLITTKKWKLNDSTNAMGLYPHGPSDLYSTDTIPFVHPFTAYASSRLGATYNLTQLKQLYYTKCGYYPSFCLPRPLTGPTLCGKNEPIFPAITIEQHSPCDDSTSFAIWKGTLLYENYRDSIKGSFDDKYLAKCLKARYNESLTVTQSINEFHYTLYYYDQAGNLLKTVPPAGVDLSKFSVGTWSDQVKTARANKTVLTPVHTLVTDYRYNTLNQVVAQKSPDGGISEFWYDRLGRLAVSRNARQKADTVTSLYSYTKYDYLGRIAEVGQIKNTVASDTMKDATSRNATTLYNWLLNRNNLRGQITETVYDLPYTGFIGLPDNIQRLVIAQRNLRNRVSYVRLVDSGNSVNHSAATYYTYDIHGNVDTLLQDYGREDVAAVANMMNKNNNRFKKIIYKYDLISGKVNMVQYQPNWGDQFIHRYSYDAENRLTLVETSPDSLVWEREARYEYYRHGPLARMVIGEQLVQGVDYAYTLQGWLKGVNSTGATATHDMGGDGRNTGDVLNRYTGRDIMSYTLNYFTGDYAPINAGMVPFPGSSAYLGTAYRPLYNGNISSMATHLRPMSDPSSIGGPIMLYNYKYDQLNRLTAMDSYNNFDTATNGWTGSGTPQYSYNERIAYDGNGNILKYLRNANTYNSGPVMDSLTYKYYTGTNRLQRVTDRASSFDSEWGANSWEYNLDINHQTQTSNYLYDPIGNLIKDTSEKITSIKWSVYGKIQEINRVANTQNPVTKIVYKYDAQGNRIGKIVTKNTGVREHTWYVRDAQGNVMSTYGASGPNADNALNGLTTGQNERYIYGSSRLGVDNWYMPADSNTVYDYNYPGLNSATYYYRRGWKQYELSNHLGNVLVTISDKKIGIPLPSSSLIDYYEPVVVSAQDYYPFGMLMPKRSYSAASGYRYGFNGKENDNDVKGLGNQQDYGMRIYDPRIGKFLSVDPMTSTYPWYTPYQFAGNQPIEATDVDGLEPSITRNKIGYNYFSPPTQKQANADQVKASTTENSSRSILGSLWSGASRSANDILKSVSGSSIKNGYKEAKGTIKDFGNMMIAKPGAAKSFSDRVVNGTIGLSNTVIQPAIFLSTMHTRSINENAYGIGYYGVQFGIGYATDRFLLDMNTVGGIRSSMPSRTFNHFTNIEGVTGITGINTKLLDNLSVGESIVVSQASFGKGTNSFMARNPGDIFVTDLSVNSTKAQLERRPGVFGDKQNFAIGFSEAEATEQGVRIRGSNPERGIYTIPANSTIKGTIKITKLK